MDSPKGEPRTNTRGDRGIGRGPGPGPAHRGARVTAQAPRGDQCLIEGPETYELLFGATYELFFDILFQQSQETLLGNDASKPQVL